MQLNIDVIRQFWATRAQADSNRWTGEDLLAFELSWLRPLATGARTILDLGSGHGELSRRLCPPSARLVAIDYEGQFRSAFTKANHEFHEIPVTDFHAANTFDLALLFGVVTCLELKDEVDVYQRMADALAPTGVAVIKNQCAIGSEFAIDTYSEALGERYSGRYPNASEQRERLGAVFSEVEALQYPERFNKWRNTAHIAFICRSPVHTRAH